MLTGSFVFISKDVEDVKQVNVRFLNITFSTESTREAESVLWIEETIAVSLVEVAEVTHSRTEALWIFQLQDVAEQVVEFTLFFGTDFRSNRGTWFAGFSVTLSLCFQVCGIHYGQP
ncbi:hypothetical protein D3C75_732980 [compost metagenome]